MFGRDFYENYNRAFIFSTCVRVEMIFLNSYFWGYFGVSGPANKAMGIVKYPRYISN